MDPSLPWIGTLVLSVAGASIGTYFTTRAKNLATHDDLDRLVEQVQAVTRETEAIKAEITGGLWDRKKRWEVRRDILIEFMRIMGRVDPALRDFVSCCCQSKPEVAEEQKVWKQFVTEASRKWLDTTSEWEEAKGLLDVVSGEELRKGSSAWFSLRIRIASEARCGNTEHYTSSMQELNQSSSWLYAAIRKELGIEEL